jgi:beta-phosphoglucomutase
MDSLNFLSKYKYHLFDLDQTIIDSSRLHADAFISVLKCVKGFDLSAFSYSKVAGMSTVDAFVNILKPNFNNLDLSELVSMKQACYRKSIRKGNLTILPGVSNYLSSLVDHDCFIVSGSSHSTIQLILDMYLIDYNFVGFVSGDEVSCSKPSPEPYLKAIDKFALTAEYCVAYEDSLNGLLSATSAGLRCVYISSDPSISTIQSMHNLSLI